VSEPPEVYRRRRATALAALVAGALVLVGLSVRACGGGAPAAAPTTPVAAVPRPPAPRELPGGGRRIFPEHRVIAFYGAPQADSLGALGIGTPAQAAARLVRVARGYAKRTRPVLPALELISTIAAAHPGEDGLYRLHQPPEVIDRYLRAARRVKGLLVLDIQPGRGDFLSEARALERWLREPDVGIALDPEWHAGPTEIPGQTIGSVTAAEINEVSSYVSGIVRSDHLPEKLFVVHQFTQDMIRDEPAVQAPPGLAMTINADGFGDRANKVSKYDLLTSGAARFNDGFKLFYQEDTNLMTPGEVLALGPPPDLVVYE
jgi:hypothetical protein